MEEEIISTIRIKHNNCGKSREQAEKFLKELLIADGYQVVD
jgi:hypothetical protein